MTAKMVVESSSDTETAGVVPKSTVEPAVKPLPLMVTTVPPIRGPPAGATPLTAGSW